MNSPVVFTSEQLTILNVLNQAYLNNTFNAESTSTGASPLTLNTRSGVAVFTDAVPDAEMINLRISNSLITASTKLTIGLSYSSSPSFGILVLAGYVTGSGYVDVSVYNLDGVDSTQDITITFQIL